MKGPPARGVLQNQADRNGETCREKIRLLDAFTEATAEYARVQNEPSVLPEHERKMAVTNARSEYEQAKVALRLHRKQHGC
jgi:hypothetical protein